MEHALKSSTGHSFGVGDAMEMGMGQLFGSEPFSSNLQMDNGDMMMMSLGCDERKSVGVAEFCAEDALRILESCIPTNTSPSENQAQPSHSKTIPAPKAFKRKQSQDQLMDLEPTTIFCPAERMPLQNEEEDRRKVSMQGRHNRNTLQPFARSTAAQHAALVLADYYGMDPLQIHLFAQFTGQVARSRSAQFANLSTFRNHNSYPLLSRRNQTCPTPNPNPNPTQQYKVPFPRVHSDDGDLSHQQSFQSYQSSGARPTSGNNTDHSDHAHTTTGSEDEHDDDDDDEEVSSCGEMISPSFTPRADLADLLHFHSSPSQTFQMNKIAACSESIMSNQPQTDSNGLEALIDASLVNTSTKLGHSNFAEADKMPDSSHYQRSMFVCDALNSSNQWNTQMFTNGRLAQTPEERKFTCEECGKMYKQKSHLKVHRRTHQGVRPFCCKFDSCGKTFVTNSALRAHERVHSGERPYQCVFEGCGRMFSTNSNLRRHERTHSQRAPK